MGAWDFQFAFEDEVSFGTSLTPTRFAEYNGDPNPMHGVPGRTEGNPLRVGSRARVQNRVVPYGDHAEGTLEFDVMNKGFGKWLKHMLPSVAATGSGPFVYTATEGSSSALMGKSFTAQFNAPLHPAGTNQAMTYSGGKVLKWTLANSVDDMLSLSFDLWFSTWTTATALATASYPSTMKNFSWVDGVVSIGGTAFDCTSVSVEVDQGYNVDRAQIRGNSAKKEPTPGQLGVSWSLEADFADLTQYNRVHSATQAGLYAQIIGTWTNGTDIISATIPAGRFDDFAFGGDPGALTQTLTGVGEYNLSASPITVVYTTADTTA